MNENVHKGVAKAYFKVAEEYDQKFRKEINEEKRKVNRIVAAQNYFYSAINVIEAVFARELEQHSFNHENRLRLMIEHRDIFTDEILEIYEVVDRNLRNKVAYRGENGPKYKGIKLLAALLIKRFP